MAVKLVLLLCFVAKDMRSSSEVAALGKAALKVTLGTWGYLRGTEGKSRGPGPVWKSMLRTLLRQEAEKGKPISPQILNVRRFLGTEFAKSRVVRAATGVTGDFNTVEHQDPMLISQIITVKATRIAALVSEPPTATHLNILTPRGCARPGCMKKWRVQTRSSADLKLSLAICTKFWTRRQTGASMMIFMHRAWAT